MDLFAVEGCGVGVVLQWNISVFGDAAGREEGVEGVVAAGVGLHFPEVGVGPGVHGDGADEAEVDAEAAVLAGAVEAHEDAIGDGSPLGVLLVAVDAGLVGRQRLEVAKTP